jgi:hypothetical protein
VSNGNSLYTQGSAAGSLGKNTTVFDYGVGADFTWKSLTLNVSYIGTDMNHDFADLNYGASTRETGHQITQGNVVATLTASF